MAHTPSPASPVVSGSGRWRRDRSSKSPDQPVRAPGAPTNLLTRSNTSRSPSLPSLITRSTSSGSNPKAPYSPTWPPCSSYRHCQCALGRRDSPRTLLQGKRDSLITGTQERVSATPVLARVLPAPRVLLWILRGLGSLVCRNLDRYR